MLFSCFAASSFAVETTVVLFVVDGVQGEAMKVAAANGAGHFRFLIDQGVWVEEAYSPTPAPRMTLPDGSLPWGTASAPNVAMHTGTHVFESPQIDDIFLSARRAGIKSVFAGGAENYRVFTTPDFTYAGRLSDAEVVQHGIDHFRKDGVRLIRLHLQEIRNSWTGPEDQLDPHGKYQRHLQEADALLGKLIATLKQAGVWDVSYVIAGGDHGMGNSKQSNHPPSVASSWKPFMVFYGPGLKRGATIPYAETPDMAIMANYFLKLKPLAGYTDPAVNVEPKGTTGTFLSNILEGSPRELKHPRFIRRYLENNGWAPPDAYGDYRRAMLSLIKDSTPAEPHRTVP